MSDQTPHDDGGPMLAGVTPLNPATSRPEGLPSKTPTWYGRDPHRELVDFSRWVTESYGRLPAETILWRRVTKPSLEAAEALEALAGMVGENPRKGVTHAQVDVEDELLDTAVAALGAIEHLRGYDGEAIAMLNDHICRVAARARDLPVGGLT